MIVSLLSGRGVACVIGSTAADRPPLKGMSAGAAVVEPAVPGRQSWSRQSWSRW